jgi:hypothetical protein
MGISRSVKLMKKGGKAAYKPGYAHVSDEKTMCRGSPIFSFKGTANYALFKVITVISGQIPRRPLKPKNPKPRLTYRYFPFCSYRPAHCG